MKKQAHRVDVDAQAREHINSTEEIHFGATQPISPRQLEKRGDRRDWRM